MKQLTIMMLCSLALAAGPATRPTTRPATTAPAVRVRDGLINGSVRFLVPADWNLISRADNGLSVVYRTADEVGTLSILITQQQEAIPLHDARVRAQMQK